MTELAWREVFPPHGLSSAQVTAMIRVLNGRPHLGLLQLQPVVVFELWITHDSARWLLGCDDQIARLSTAREF